MLSHILSHINYIIQYCIMNNEFLYLMMENNKDFIWILYWSWGEKYVKRFNCIL